MTKHYIQIEDKFLNIKISNRNYHGIYMGYVNHICKSLAQHKIDSKYVKEIFQEHAFISRLKCKISDTDNYIEAVHYVIGQTKIELYEQLREDNVFSEKFTQDVQNRINFIKKIENVRSQFENDINKIKISNDGIKFSHKRKKYRLINYEEFIVSEQKIFDTFMCFLNEVINDYQEIISKNFIINKKENNYDKHIQYYIIYAEKDGESGFVDKDYDNQITKNFAEARIIEGNFDIEHTLSQLSSCGLKNMKAIDFTINLNLQKISEVEVKNGDDFIYKITASKEKELLQEQLNVSNTKSKKFKV